MLEYLLVAALYHVDDFPQQAQGRWSKLRRRCIVLNTGHFCKKTRFRLQKLGNRMRAHLPVGQQP